MRTGQLEIIATLFIVIACIIRWIVGCKSLVASENEKCGERLVGSDRDLRPLPTQLPPEESEIAKNELSVEQFKIQVPKDEPITVHLDLAEQSDTSHEQMEAGTAIEELAVEEVQLQETRKPKDDHVKRELRRTVNKLSRCLNEEKKVSSSKELIRAAKFAARQQYPNNVIPLRNAIEHLLCLEIYDEECPWTVV